MISDYERAPAKVRAGPGQRGRLGRSGSTAAARVESVPDRRRAGATHRWALPVADTAGLAAASVASGLSGGVPGILLRAGYVAVVLIILAATGQHRLRICLRVSDEVSRVLIATIVPVLALLACLPAHRALSLAVWSGGLVLFCRSLLYAALRAAHRRGLLTEPTVVVGAGTFGAYVAGLTREHPELGLHLVGLLDGGPPRRDLPVPFLGGPADLADVVGRLGISRVIMCFSSACHDEDFVSVMRASRPLRADVCVVPRLYELGMALPRGCLDEIWGIPLIPLRRSGQSSAALALKRIFDVVACAVILALAAPLMLVLVIAVRLRTGQAALFRQARVTGDGRTAQITKLRTLTAHDDHDTRWTPAEPSPLGRWLRATHLDELPQLVNVMRGEMSLVGPRPERPYFADRFGHEVPGYGDRTRMPGRRDGMGAGQRPQRGHVDLRSSPVRQLLRGVLVALAGSGHPHPDRGCRGPRHPVGGHPMTVSGGNHKTRTRVAAGRLALGRVPMILMYHGVADVADDPNQLCVTPGRFAEQLAALQRLGLRGVSVGTLVDAMRAGRQHGLVGITFDDGYVSVLEAAVPELQRRDFTATVFIVSGRLGGTNRVGRGTSMAAADRRPGGEARGRGNGDRLAQRDTRTAGRPGCRPDRSRGQREQSQPWRTHRRSGPGLRLPLRLDERDGPADGPGRGLRLRLRRGDSDGRPRAHGAAQDLRRPARRCRPPGSQAISLPRIHRSQGGALMKVLHVITGLDVGGAEIQLSLILKHTRHDSDVVTLYNPGPVADQIRAAAARASAISACDAIPS